MSRKSDRAEWNAHKRFAGFMGIGFVLSRRNRVANRILWQLRKQGVFRPQGHHGAISWELL